MVDAFQAGARIAIPSTVVLFFGSLGGRSLASGGAALVYDKPSNVAAHKKTAEAATRVGKQERRGIAPPENRDGADSGDSTRFRDPTREFAARKALTHRSTLRV